MKSRNKIQDGIVFALMVTNGFTGFCYVYFLPNKMMPVAGGEKQGL